MCGSKGVRQGLAGGLLLGGLAIAAACSAPVVDYGPRAHDSKSDDADDADEVNEKKTTATTPVADASAGSHCGDHVKNGDETDVDCGGSCAPCADGKACKIPNDCAAKGCEGNLCCSHQKKTVVASTGPISGTKRLCCAAGGTLSGVKDCGDGHNHGAQAIDDHCAEAHEGSGNGGSACVEITCVVTVCGTANPDAGVH
jgi:hypothetical protein